MSTSPSLASTLLSLALGAAALAACDPTIAPGKAEPGTIGAPCEAPEACTQVSDPECLRIGADGYCASDCAGLGQFVCPSGAICEELGDQAVYCIDGCCSEADCRDGFRCARRPSLDIYVDLGVCTTPGVCLARCTSDAACEVGTRCNQSSGECVPKKGVDAGVGARCDKGEDCNSGTCLTSFPGGYCTSPCGTQFQGCEPGSECYAIGDGSASCLLLCQTNDECRAGYHCLEAASGDSGKILGYCVPRCETSGCPDGQSCGADGGCVDGAAGPGPIGAFCDGDGECESGECDLAQPNGYCTTGCNSCDGPCVAGACRAACDSEADCRFAYVCTDGACLAACRSDADCVGEEVCDTGSGLCRTRSTGGQVVEFASQTVTVTQDGSEQVAFSVPEGAVSAVVHASDSGSELIALWQVFAPGDTLVYDITDPVNSRFGVLPTESNFSALLPPGPVFNFIPGTYRVSFVRDGGSAQTQVRVFGKVMDGFPERQNLDLVLTFVGAPEGIDANAAKSDGDFQQAMNVLTSLYGNLGLDLGTVVYEDLGGGSAGALRTIDSIEGAGNELGQLFAQSKSLGQGINFFFVQEIVGGDEGFIILGIAGGIPGPPAIQGTPHSGVALTMMGFRDSPQVLGQTMAHEGGHYLGLFHTSESSGSSHDPLPDTLQCKSSNDDDFDGYVTTEECAQNGSDNFMFWLASEGSSRVSPEQGNTVRRNPATK